jgi:hypothetical protein
VNQVEGADVVRETERFLLEVVASAEWGDIPFLCKASAKAHGLKIQRDRPQIVGDIERSIRQESSNAMNLKALWNTGGYCLCG